MDWHGLQRATPPPLPASHVVPQGRSYLSAAGRGASDAPGRPTGQLRSAKTETACDAIAMPRQSQRAFDRFLIVMILMAVAVTSFGIVSAVVPGGRISPAATAAGGAARTQAPRIVQATLGALHDANLTGNYMVFRLLAAPAFQAANSTEELARIFAGQRQFPLDLAAIASGELVWDLEPVANTSGVLRLAGSYPATKDLRLQFDFSYVLIEERWRLLEIETTLQPASISALIGMNGR